MSFSLSVSIYFSIYLKASFAPVVQEEKILEEIISSLPSLPHKPCISFFAAWLSISFLNLILFIKIYPSFCSPHSGLVATIKEHITKPTAMAQGRVAHLIEWKGWGGGGEATGGWSGAWGKGGGSWGAMGANLQEDEQFYSQMTDEIKEARFAAGETDG